MRNWADEHTRLITSWDDFERVPLAAGGGRRLLARRVPEPRTCPTAWP